MAEREAHVHLQGWACKQFPASGKPAEATLAPLLDAIVAHVPPPAGDPGGEFKMLVTMLEADAFVGRIATGRVASGTARVGDRLRVITRDGVGASLTFLAVFVALHRTKTAYELLLCTDLVTVLLLHSLAVVCSLSCTAPYACQARVGKVYGKATWHRSQA